MANTVYNLDTEVNLDTVVGEAVEAVDSIDGFLNVLLDRIESLDEVVKSLEEELNEVRTQNKKLREAEKND